ncbi:MAG: hypothetical protein ACOX3U_01810 [Christensenellales bacterium]|jgi:nucleoside 2-deoxyribosyltransferase
MVIGPEYNENERENLLRLSDFLDEEYFACDYKIVKAFIDKSVNAEGYLRLSKLSLAAYIYGIIKSGHCVALLNGKDESVLVKAGIAYAIGIPVFLYKYDPRVNFIAGENSMALGLSGFKLYKNLKKLKKAVKNNRVSDNEYPDFIEKLLTTGGEVYEYLKQGREITGLLEHFIDKSDFDAGIRDIKDIQINARKAYCSGPLFSPDEQREMKYISDALENSGYETFLPQRDGAEPYVLKSMGGKISAA